MFKCGMENLPDSFGQTFLISDIMDSTNHIAPNDIGELYNPFVKKLISKGYSFLGSGSFREVYRKHNVIVKVPRCVDGVIDNIIEAKAYSVYRNKPTSLGLILAPAKLIINYCLMMPYLETNPDASNEWLNSLPGWVANIDNFQVGIRNNKLMAYDYALNMKERYQWEEELGIKSKFFNKEWRVCHPYFFPLKEKLQQEMF